MFLTFLLTWEWGKWMWGCQDTHGNDISEWLFAIFCNICMWAWAVIRKLEGHLELIENILAHAGGDDVPWKISKRTVNMLHPTKTSRERMLTKNRHDVFLNICSSCFRLGVFPWCPLKQILRTSGCALSLDPLTLPWEKNLETKNTENILPPKNTNWLMEGYFFWDFFFAFASAFALSLMLLLLLLLYLLMLLLLLLLFLLMLLLLLLLLLLSAHLVFSCFCVALVFLFVSTVHLFRSLSSCCLVASCEFVAASAACVLICFLKFLFH